MKFFKAIASIASIAFFSTGAFAQEDDALRNMQMGMAGLQQAAKDPALLAQLMQDLQNPEMMAEAQKMMDSPEFKKQMKQLTGDKGFKDSIKKTADMLKDPNAAAQMEAKMEHMAKVGADQLKKGAGAAMEEAMNAMANPEVMAEMVQLMKDPSFKQQIEAMSKDPSFQNYAAAMKDMMNDPAKKAKVEQASESIRAAL
mmetsp:Transcript_19847/g.27545  ORF Transcript_19847/g.27545 Transcript_19847/m.27545 type:complete len:199 (-) Transcript_19847:176-772(-)